MNGRGPTTRVLGDNNDQQGYLLAFLNGMILLVYPFSATTTWMSQEVSSWLVSGL